MDFTSSDIDLNDTAVFQSFPTFVAPAFIPNDDEDELAHKPTSQAFKLNIHNIFLITIGVISFNL